ncbi:class I SAM-dependent methyltransferase [bacterium]|nr:class I SAM-dependent methyltransferase [bacterium]
MATATANGTGPQTREAQYQDYLNHDLQRFGVYSGQTWRDDPRRLVFMLARYKFVAKMLSGKARVVEIGASDVFGARLVMQEGCRVTATDFDPVFLADARDRMAADGWACETLTHDMLTGPVPPADFDAAYSLDVFEHITPDREDVFVHNVARSVTADGVALIGSPSLQSQAYASPASKAGHVNCKDGAAYKAVMLRHFKNVFLFSMNDEVVHTGFSPTAHYLFALCVGPRG